MKLKSMGAILLLTMFLLAAYQNCGQINLAESNESSSLEARTYLADFCVRPIAGVQYSLVSAVALNLNAIPVRGQFLSDSDMDGVPDSEEVGDYSSTNARSKGYLDYICLSSGTCPAVPTCSNTGVYFQPGLTTCDLDAYTSISIPVNVFDSNFNGIPDYIEVIRKGDPFSLTSGLADPDRDGFSVNQEILNSTDPRYSDAGLALAHRTIIRKISNTSACPSPFENYEITKPAVPFVATLDFVDPNNFQFRSGSTFNLSHAKNENLIYTALILRSRDGVSPIQYKGFLHLDKISESSYPGAGTGAGVVIRSDDFFSVGSWEQ